jgi:hypothetical protein
MRLVSTPKPGAGMRLPANGLQMDGPFSLGLARVLLHA